LVIDSRIEKVATVYVRKRFLYSVYYQTSGRKSFFVTVKVPRQGSVVRNPARLSRRGSVVQNQAFVLLSLAG